MSMPRDQEKPDCFGIIDRVFPMGDDGLRHSPEACMACIHKTDCLRSAIANPDGVKVREEIVDRAYQSENIGFFERWSRRKYLSQLKEKNTGRQKSKKL